MVLGIIGGILGLIVGFFGYGYAEVGTVLADATGGNANYDVFRYVGIAAPIACLVGATLSTKQPTSAGLLMGGSAIAMAVVFGVGTFTIFPIALASVGAVMTMVASKNTLTTR